MKKIRNLLLATAITCIILGVITIGTPIFALIEFILGGIIMYTINKDDKAIQNQKKYLIILAALLIVFNQVGAIILFIAIDNIDALIKDPIRAGPELSSKDKFVINSLKKNKQIDPGLRKIDILLKLGVAMVAISGLLFATTSWDLITAPVKVLALIFMGIIFMGLSKFSKEKLHIETTTFTYWLLAMFFFTFSIVSIGALGIFGEWLTYKGPGGNVMYAITYTSISIFSYLTYKKKNNAFFHYLTFTGIFITLYNLLRFLTLDKTLSVIVLECLFLLINISKNEKTNLQKFSTIASYIIASAPFIITEDNSLLMTFACLLNIVNINYIALKKNNSEDIFASMSTIFSYILLTRIVELLNFKEYNYIIAILIYTFFAIIIKHNKVNKNNLYQIINNILYYIFATFCFAMTLQEDITIMLISSTLILAFNIIESVIDDKDNISICFQPIAIFFFILSLSKLITTEIELVNISLMAILSLIYTTIYHFTKDKLSKKIYYYSSLVAIVLSLITSIENIEKITSLITLGCFIYHYLVEIDIKKRIPLYIGILTNIYITFITLELLPLPIIYNSLITLWLYVLCKLLLKENKTIDSITSIAIVIPTYTIVSNLTISYEYQEVLSVTLSLYVLYLIVSLLLKKQETKKIVSIIGIVLLLLTIFESNIVKGVYIGIVGIIVMMIGYNNKDYKEFFATGIAITIVNIVYQLQDLWTKIPFWLYLLITGLGLIGFVTYKEIKKSDSGKAIQNEKEIDEQLEIQETPKIDKKEVNTTDETKHLDETYQENKQDTK